MTCGLGGLTLAGTAAGTTSTGVVTAAGPAVTAAPRAAPEAPTLPGRIGAPRKVLQMITVTSPAWGSTSGTLKAWQRSPGGRWRVMHGPLPIVLGYSGWVVADHRLQNTGTTPAGRFA